MKAQIAKSNLISDIHEERKASEPENQNNLQPAATDESDTEAADETEITRGQIDAYLKDPLLARDKDPLKWWESHQHKFPLPNDHARRDLYIPGSSATSEKMFKQTKRIDKQRPSILPKNMEMLLFIKYNLRAIGYTINLHQPPPDWNPPTRTRFNLSCTKTLLRTGRCLI